MKMSGVFAAGVALAAVAGGAMAAGPAAPVATYWVDAATASGFGAGMGSGNRPSMDQVMAMMQGRGAPAHTLELRLASKTKATAPVAEHLPPAALAMGPSLPLITPAVAKPVKAEPFVPGQYERPKGRMLIYWGCGERASAGQPTVIDFASVAAEKVPPAMAALAATAARTVTRPGPGTAAGYGEWPNPRDSRPVPAQGSLVGAHKVQANYAPPIAFTLAAGQDFMPDLGLAEAGTLPSGAVTLRWRPAASATGYALALFGANQAGDVVIWTSANKASSSPVLDYVAPAEVKRQIGLGTVLAPSVSQCVLPAEVARAVPAGMVTMIGYGPEVHFSEAPKAPKWTAKVRFKTTATLMRGMGEMGGMDVGDAQAVRPQGEPAQPRRRRRGFGLGDILREAVPVPIP